MHMGDLTERVHRSRPAPNVLDLIIPLHAESSAWNVRKAWSNCWWNLNEWPSSRNICRLAQTTNRAVEGFASSAMSGLTHSWMVVE